MITTKKLIESFLSNEKTAIKGFSTLQEIYEQANSFIDSNALFNQEFSLLGLLRESLIKTFNNIDMKLLCNNFNWYAFAINVIYLNTCEKSPNKEDVQRDELQNLFLISGLIGRSLQPLSVEDKKRWYEKILGFNLVDDLNNRQQIIFAKCIFYFLASQLVNDKNNLISSFFLKKIIKDAQSVKSHFIHASLFFYCYLYYLGYRESEKIIEDLSEDIRERSQAIIESSKEIFSNLLYAIAFRDPVFTDYSYNSIKIFNKDLSRILSQVLTPYEHFVDYEAKTIIMNDVVEDFVSFCLIHIKYVLPFHKPFLNQIYSEDDVRTLCLKYNKDKNKYLPLLNDFKTKFISENTEDLDSYNNSFTSFCYKLMEIEKKRILNESKDFIKVQKNRILEEKIQNNFNQTFSKMFDDNLKCEKVSLLRIENVPSQFSVNQIMDFENDTSIYSNLQSYLLKRMEQSKKLQCIKRNSLKDEELLKLIDSHKDDVFIGNPTLLDVWDMANFFKEYSEKIKNLHIIATFANPYGLFLNKKNFRICIKEINAVSRAMAFEDVVGSIQSMNNGYFKYALEGIDMSLTKPELERYWSTHTKVFEITAELGYELLDSESKINVLVP